MKGLDSSSTQAEAARLLFAGQYNHLAVIAYQNERPPGGLLGVLDWYFRGEISQLLKAGALSGKEGECAYLPCQLNHLVYHLYLLGAGHSDSHGHRTPVSVESIQALRKNLLSLKIDQVGISKSDFGNLANDFLIKQLKGVSVWIAQ